jgi:hypothetical protein
MWNMNDVVKIRYRGEYVYLITFDDGVEGNVDFSIYLDRGSIFFPLKKKKFFKKAVIEGGTISWANGADIAPETLYEKIGMNHSPCHSARSRRIHALSSLFEHDKAKGVDHSQKNKLKK